MVLASSNRIRGNLASPNTNVAVVLVGDFNVLEGNALLDNIAGVVVIGNQTFANLDGIRVRGAAVVSGNVEFGNIDDGIDFAAGSAFIQGNTATQNGDLGINAAGAFDGGGNRAFANANPLQCMGVVCS